MATEFDTKINIRSFSLTSNDFNQTCSQIYDLQGLSGQQIATVTEHDGIPSINASNWTVLASAESVYIS